MNFVRLLAMFLLSGLSVTTAGLTDTRGVVSGIVPGYFNPPQSVKLSKFSFTQKGYIQFLRYITDVPPIEDFTFCLWMRSVNFTYSHPLLSYSRHDEERLIRAWITPGGEEIILAIKEVDIIKIPVAFKEHQWYHICQSWSTKTGHWDLFLNGKLKSHGYNTKVRGEILPKDGDIVVGQEYTDFDKGLDDGIEGDVFGFNLILASASPPQKYQRGQKEAAPYFRRRASAPEKIKGHYIVASSPLTIRRISKSLDNDETSNKNSSMKNSTISSLQRTRRQSYGLYPVSYFRLLPPEVPQKIMLKPVPYFGNRPYAFGYQFPLVSAATQTPVLRNKNSRIANEISVFTPKPLGLQLVELSYRCDLGKGAPLKGKDVLISWTKTPVRVFGGALLKKVDPFCY